MGVTRMERGMEAVGIIETHMMLAATMGMVGITGTHQLLGPLAERREECLPPATTTSSIMSPPTVAMAFEGVKGAKWVATMEANLESLWENGVYEDVPQPQGKKVIGTKWVLRIKTDVAGNLDKYKARVVAKCKARQVEGLDYDESYAPIVRFVSVRALVAMVASLG